jgi:hypothetical protein
MIKKILLGLLFFASYVIHAQETIAVSGGEALGSGGKSSYTVGQAFYTTNGSITQGVQQAYEFQTLSNLTLTSLSLKALMYPNPTSDYIVLKISEKSALKNLRYTLSDLNGKSIANENISSTNTLIKMQYLSIGMYLLKVSQNNKEIKTFKIIKK